MFSSMANIINNDGGTYGAEIERVIRSRVDIVSSLHAGTKWAWAPLERS